MDARIFRGANAEKSDIIQNFSTLRNKEFKNKDTVKIHKGITNSVPEYNKEENFMKTQ